MPDAAAAGGRFTIRLDAPLPELGAAAGDWIYVDPSDPEYPVSVIRHLGADHLAALRDRLPLLQRLAAVAAPAGVRLVK